MARQKKLSEKRRKEITRAIEKTAKKQARKYGSISKPLKVQTSSFWKRVITMLVALCFAGGSFYAFIVMGATVLSLGCVATALVLSFLAIMG